ncbi:MAG: MBL fold metallo-hydrolase [Butyricicoccus porcorum]
MRITYLGTGGGAGIPELFCCCEICQNARTVQGRELRSRSLALINDDLCIDLPCDARNSMLAHHVDPRKLKYFLVTHNHYDHFMPDNFINRPANVQQMELYISSGSGKAFADRCAKLEVRPSNGLRPINIPQIRFLSPFETAQIGRYTVTALPANHDKAVESLNYIISDGESSILWLHDTGVLLDETWLYLKEHKTVFDFISMDCTFPRGTNSKAEHMDMQQCKELADTLWNMGYIRDRSLVYLSHIGHNVNVTHQNLMIEASNSNLRVAYDGMQVSI